MTHSNDYFSEEEYSLDDDVEVIDEDYDEDEVIYSTDDGEHLYSSGELEAESVASTVEEQQEAELTLQELQRRRKAETQAKQPTRTTTDYKDSVDVETVISSQSDATGFKGTVEPSQWKAPERPANSLKGVKEGDEEIVEEEDEPALEELQQQRKREIRAKQMQAVPSRSDERIEVETVISSQSDATGFKGAPEPSQWKSSSVRAATTNSLSGVQEVDEEILEQVGSDDEEEEELEETGEIESLESPSKGKGKIWDTLVQSIHSSQDLDLSRNEDGDKEPATGTESTAPEEEDDDDDNDEFGKQEEIPKSPQPSPSRPSSSFQSPLQQSLRESLRTSPFQSPKPRPIPKPREPEESAMHEMMDEENWAGLLKIMEQLRKQDSSTILYELTKTDPKERSTILHRAVRHAPNTLSKLLISIVPFDSRHEILLHPDADGNAPLHWACANLQISSKTNTIDETIIKALAVGAPEAHDIRNSRGEIPLSCLLASPAMKAAVDPSQEDLLAVEAAAEDLVRRIIQERPDLASTQTKSGKTLLHIGAEHRVHERILLFLFENAGYAAELSDSVGRLPLHYLASSIAGPSPPLALAERLVLASMESLTTPCSEGNTPLHLMVRSLQTNISKDEDRSSFGIERLAETLLGRSADESMCPLLVKNKEGMTPLHFCARYSSPVNVLQILMESPFAGKAANMSDSNKATPFHIICGSSNISEMTKQIGYFGTTEASLKKDGKGRTPLHVAAENSDCDKDAMEAIIEVNPKAAKEENSRMRLPLHLALRKKLSDDVVKVLLKAHPKAVKAVFEGDNGVIHEMCQHRTSSSLIHLMLTLHPEGAQLANKFKNLPLHVATAYQCDLATIKCLVKAYPEACMRPNKHKDLPLHYATSYTKSTDVIEYLVKAAPGAVMIPNEKNETPFDQCKQKGLEGLLAQALDEAANMIKKKKKKQDEAEEEGQQSRTDAPPADPSSPIKPERMESPQSTMRKSIRVPSKAAKSEEKEDRGRSKGEEPGKERRSRSREPGERARSKSRDRSKTRGRSKSKDRGSDDKSRSKSKGRSGDDKTRGRSKSKDRSSDDKKEKKRDKSVDKSTDKKKSKWAASLEKSKRDGRPSKRESSVEPSSRKRDKSVDKKSKRDPSVDRSKVKRKSKSMDILNGDEKSDYGDKSPTKSKSSRRSRSLSPSREARRSKSSSRSLKVDDDEDEDTKHKLLRGRKSRLHKSISALPSLASPKSPTFLRKSKASLALREEIDDGTISELPPTASVASKRASKKLSKSKPTLDEVEQTPGTKKKKRGSILKTPTTVQRSKSLDLTYAPPKIPLDLHFDALDYDDVSSQMESPSAIKKDKSSRKSKSSRKMLGDEGHNSSGSISLGAGDNKSSPKKKSKSSKSSRKMLGAEDNHSSGSISLGAGDNKSSPKKKSKSSKSSRKMLGDEDNHSSGSISLGAGDNKSSPKKKSKSSKSSRKMLGDEDNHSSGSISLGAGDNKSSPKKKSRSSKVLNSSSVATGQKSKSTSRRKSIKDDSASITGLASPSSKKSSRRSSKMASSSNLEASHSGGFSTPNSRRAKRGSLVDELVDSPMHRSALLSAPYM